jgi:hypothetical protein
VHSKVDEMDPAQTSNQSRIGIEGRGGSKSPNLISRSSFRYVFVGGMVAAGLTWYASSHGWLGSSGEKINAASRGGSKPPTFSKDKVDEAPSATAATKPSQQAHTGAAQGISEGSKPK